MATTFIDVDRAIAIHASQIALWGGSLGLRDRGALESAVAQAEAGFGEELFHPTLFDQAAAYLFHITKNHPFIDGNKRAGFATAATFLAMNGLLLAPDSGQDAYYDLTIRVATGEADKAAIASFFREACAPA